LRQCTRSRKAEGSFPDEVTGIFHWLSPSGRTMTFIGESASNRKEYQDYLLGSKGDRCVGSDNSVTCLSRLSRNSGVCNLLETEKPVQLYTGFLFRD
jgi:hypothetical protein